MKEEHHEHHHNHENHHDHGHHQNHSQHANRQKQLEPTNPAQHDSDQHQTMLHDHAAGKEVHTAPMHDKHAGHHTEDFFKRFWVCLVVTVPILLLSRSSNGWDLKSDFLGINMFC